MHVFVCSTYPTLNQPHFPHSNWHLVMRLSFWPTQVGVSATHLLPLVTCELTRMQELLQDPKGWMNDAIIDTFMGSLQEQYKEEHHQDSIHFYSSAKVWLILNDRFDASKEATPSRRSWRQPGMFSSFILCPLVFLVRSHYLDNLRRKYFTPKQGTYLTRTCYFSQCVMRENGHWWSSE